MLNELDDRNACKDKLSILSGESSSGNIQIFRKYFRIRTYALFNTSFIGKSKIALLMKIMSMGAR